MKKILFLLLLTVALLILNILYGSVSIPPEQVLTILTGGEGEKASWTYIIWQSRLPQAITAMLCGGSLAVSGLLLQTLFRNPLAGPSILGITNGASLGVAIVILLSGGVITAGTVQTSGLMAIILAALLGATAVMVLLLAMAEIVRSGVILLIVGILLGYLTSSAVALLNAFASTDNVHSYVMWGMGSFSDVSLQQLPLFTIACVIALSITTLMVKPLNALLLGDNYAQNLGIDIRRCRRMLLIATGLLTAVCTAFCGPIAFIGLAVPHITRFFITTADHRLLLPGVTLCGASVALFCNILCTLPADTILPLNAVTPLIGAPVILYVIMRKH